MQLDAPVLAWYFPPAHCEQLGAPACEKDPAAQSPEHAGDERPEELPNRPAAQSAHDDAPNDDDAYLPAAHGAQLAEPSSAANVPVGQSVHEPSPGPYRPGAHLPSRSE